MSLSEKVSRRTLLKSLSMGGVGAALLAYQNCSNIKFAPNSALSSSSVGGTCDGLINLFDTPSAPLLNKPSSFAALDQDHNPNAEFYLINYYDQKLGAESVQHILTVDVGPDPLNGRFHAMGSANTSNLDFISDLYVFNNADGSLIYWKRWNADDGSPSAIILLDEALVNAGAQLTVMVHCLEHGQFAQTIDLSQTPKNYSTAVPKFMAGQPFGGTNLWRPYVSMEATGGQGNVGALHSPDFFSVSNTQIMVTLGPHTAKHGEFAENHYVAGGWLYDQNGNLLANASELTYAMAADHILTFSGLDLSSRQVTSLRVVALDTYNGMMMGFYKIG